MRENPALVLPPPLAPAATHPHAGPTIEPVEHAPAAADFAVLFHFLDRFNTGFVGAANFAPLAVLLRNEAGATIGGLWGRTAYGWLAIQMLYVPEPHRGRGFGTALIAAAEALACRRCCVGMQVDTFDFQARGFYERQGFAVMATQDDLPPGHRCFYLIKRLR